MMPPIKAGGWKILRQFTYIKLAAATEREKARAI